MYSLSFNDDSWVYVKTSFAWDLFFNGVKKKLKSQVLKPDVWFFDLDDTHARSPAKFLARHAVGTSYFSPKYWSWCVDTGVALAFDGKRAECRRWKDYVNSFLSSSKSLGEVSKKFNLEAAKSLLYPGVEDFCSLISGRKRFYVTRNIAPVVSVYADYLGFDGFFSNAHNKWKVMEGFIVHNPYVLSYGVVGDSHDSEMVEVLKFYGKDPLSILVSEKPTKSLDDTVFDVNIGHDSSELVKIIRA